VFMPHCLECPEFHGVSSHPASALAPFPLSFAVEVSLYINQSRQGKVSQIC